MKVYPNAKLANEIHTVLSIHSDTRKSCEYHDSNIIEVMVRHNEAQTTLGHKGIPMSFSNEPVAEAKGLTTEQYQTMIKLFTNCLKKFPEPIEYERIQLHYKKEDDEQVQMFWAKVPEVHLNHYRKGKTS